MRPPLTLKALAGRRNSVLFGLSLAAAAALVGWMVYSADYLRRLRAGPEPLTLAEISNLGPAAAGRWFHVNAGDTRAQHLLQTTRRSRRGGTSVTNHFVHVGRNVQLVETSWSSVARSYYAWASDFDPTSSYGDRAKSQLRTWGLGNVPMSPILLTTSSDPATAWRNTMIILSIIGSAITAALWWTGRQMMNYLTSSPIARLKKSVRAPEGIPALVAEIDDKLAQRDPSSPRQGILLLQSWLLNAQKNSFSVMSADDVVYIAPYTLTSKKWFSKTEQEMVRIADRMGAAVELNINANETVNVLNTLYAWAPWATVGSDPHMEARFGKLSTWRKRWSAPKKQALIAEVEARRQDILARIAAYQAQQQAEAARAASPAPVVPST